MLVFLQMCMDMCVGKFVWLSVCVCVRARHPQRLYRQFLRALHHKPQATQQSLYPLIRQEFDKHRSIPLKVLTPSLPQSRVSWDPFLVCLLALGGVFVCSKRGGVRG